MFRRGGLGGVDIAALVIAWIIFSVAVWVAAELLDGIFLDGLKSILIVGAILAVLNWLAQGLLPVGVLSALTLGIFSIILNMVLLLVTDWIVQEQDVTTINFAVDDWVDALIGGLIIAVVAFILGLFLNRGTLGRGLRV